jgi:hypothetical protein
VARAANDLHQQRLLNRWSSRVSGTSVYRSAEPSRRELRRIVRGIGIEAYAIASCRGTSDLNEEPLSGVLSSAVFAKRTRQLDSVPSVGVEAVRRVVAISAADEGRAVPAPETS